MNPIEIVALAGLSAYSLYKQSHRRKLDSSTRFLLPAAYVIVGVAVGGFVLPQSNLAGVLLALGWVITLVTGFIRGVKTRVWIEEDATRWAQGTTLTITVFIAMIAAKLGLGSIAYVEHVNPAGGFGEIIASIGVMMLFQSEIVHRRAVRLARPAPTPVLVAAA